MAERNESVPYLSRSADLCCFCSFDQKVLTAACLSGSERLGNWFKGAVITCIFSIYLVGVL